jgi:hypothetical protein
MIASGENSLLYRQVFPMSRVKTRANDGTFSYMYAAYKKGDLVFRNKLYQNVLLNLDMHSDELLVYDTLHGRYLQINKNFVSSFTLAEHQFVNIDNAYYEVLYENRFKFYRKWSKVYREKLTQELIIKRFETIMTLYVMREGRLHKMRNLSAVKKYFKKYGESH